MNKIIISIFISLIFSQAFAQDNLRYFLKYEGGNTNQLVMDKEFQAVTKSFFGEYRSNYLTKKLQLTSESALEELHGPPDDIQLFLGRYLIASACRAHICPEKGFVIMDIQTGILSYALVHYSLDWSVKDSYSKDGYLTVFLKEGTPEEFKEYALKNIHDWQASFSGGPYKNIASLVPRIIYLK